MAHLKRSRVELSAQLILDMITGGKSLTVTRVDAIPANGGFGDRIVVEFEHWESDIPAGDVQALMRSVSGVIGQRGPVSVFDRFAACAPPTRQPMPSPPAVLAPTGPGLNVPEQLRDLVKLIGMTGGRGSGRSTRQIAYALAHAIESGEPVVYLVPGAPGASSYYSDIARRLLCELDVTLARPLRELFDVRNADGYDVGVLAGTRTRVEIDHAASITDAQRSDITAHHLRIAGQGAWADGGVVSTKWGLLGLDRPEAILPVHGLKPLADGGVGVADDKGRTIPGLSEDTKAIVERIEGGFGEHKPAADPPPAKDAKPAPTVDDAGVKAVHAAIAATQNRKERP